MANLVLTVNNSELQGTPESDSIAFGIYIDQGVAFTTAGTVFAQASNDDIFTLNPGALQNGVQLVYGNEGDDNIRLAKLYVAYGGQGNDSISSQGVGEAADIAGQQIFGGQGNDTIEAVGGNDYIEGNQGFDQIFAGSGLDFVLGGQDNDVIFGDSDFDVPLDNFVGNDVLYGNRGDDTIFGEGGNDLVHGGQGDDELYAEFGDEDLETIDARNDTLIGGAGQDTLTGGGEYDEDLGNATVDDVFRYESSSSSNVTIPNIDFITNFQPTDPNDDDLVPDALSLGVGDGVVLSGLNFTTATDYEVNQVRLGSSTSDFDDDLIADLDAATLPPGAVLDAVDDIAGIVGVNIIQYTNPTAITSYEQAIGAIQSVFDATNAADEAFDPIASSNSTLQVYNFIFSGEISGDFAQGQGTIAADAELDNVARRFLFINNGNTSVDSATDLFIQGVVVGTEGNIIFA